MDGAAMGEIFLVDANKDVQAFIKLLVDQDILVKVVTMIYVLDVLEPMR